MSSRPAHPGANELPRVRRRPLALRFAHQLTDLFAVVLLVSLLSGAGR